MKRSQRRTLQALFGSPTSANIAWKDIESLLKGLGAEVSEREGSRVAVVLFGEVRVFHRPHLHRTPTRAPWQACANGWNNTE